MTEAGSGAGRRPAAFRPATAADAERVSDLVHAAYGHWVERLGMRPRPMTDDYDEVIRLANVTVAEVDGELAGVLVLRTTDDGFVVDNVAVHPAHQGTGLGRALLEIAEAEAERAGFGSIVLYTHEAMTENIELCSRLGYTEFDRRSLGTFSLACMRKPIG